MFTQHGSSLGLCLASNSLHILSVQTHASRILRYLLENYIVNASTAMQRQDWNLVSSNEVQFAVMLGLGYLATLVSMDEKLICEVIDTLVAILSDEGNRCVRSESKSLTCLI